MSKPIQRFRKALWKTILWTMLLSPLTTLFAMLFPPTTIAQASPSDPISGPIATIDPPSQNPTEFSVGDYSVSEKTGAATYQFPIPVPIGRNGLSPTLSLTYSSNAPLRGDIAAGWTLPIPIIQYDKGPNPHYTVSMNGIIGQLIPVPDLALREDGITYRAENDDSFTRFEFHPGKQVLNDNSNEWTPSSWIARTTDGNIYTFGGDNASTDDDSRWYLQQISDRRGNTIEYKWERVDVGIYGNYRDFHLRRILWTGNDKANLGPHAKVEFGYGNPISCPGSSIPIGAAVDYRSGQRYVEGYYPLSNIYVRVRDEPGGTWRNVRQIHMTYAEPYGGLDSSKKPTCTGDSAPLRLLEKIDTLVWSPDGVGSRSPTITFEYGPLGLSFENSWITDELSRPSGTRGILPTLNTELLDFDGDGLLDRLQARARVLGSTTSQSWCELLVYHGRGSGRIYPNPQVIPIPSAFIELKNKQLDSCSLSGLTLKYNRYFPYGAGTVYIREAYNFAEIDGDGRLDLLTNILYPEKSGYDPRSDSDIDPDQNDGALALQLGVENYYTDDSDGGPRPPSPTDWLVMDRAQRVAGIGYFMHRNYRNEGTKFSRFSAQIPYYFTSKAGPDDGEQEHSMGHGPGSMNTGRYAMLDINGDQRMDVVGVVKPGEPDVCDTATGIQGDYWIVFSGTGNSNFVGATGSLSGYCWRVPTKWPDGPKTTRQSQGLTETRSALRDINGDGLPDLLVTFRKYTDVRSSEDELRVYFNNGRGFELDGWVWVLDKSSISVESALTYGNERAMGDRLVDVDGDGLLDRVKFFNISSPSPAPPQVRFGLGDGFGPPVTIYDNAILAAQQKISGVAVGAWRVKSDLMDMNGDGLPDLVNETSFRPRLVEAAPPGRLMAVNNGRGGRVRFEYKPSTDAGTVVQDGLRTLPQKLWVVSSVTREGGFGTPPSTTTYRYGNPVYAPLSAQPGNSYRFLGFTQSVITLPIAAGETGSGKISKKFAYAPPSGDANGRLVEQVVFGSGLKPVTIKSLSWKQAPLFNGEVIFTYLSQELFRTCLPGTVYYFCSSQTENVKRVTHEWHPYEIDTNKDPDRKVVLYTHFQMVTGSGLEVNNQDLRTTNDFRVDGYHPEEVDYQLLLRDTDQQDGSGARIGRTHIYYDADAFPVQTYRWIDATHSIVSEQSFDPATGNVLSVTKPEQVSPHLSMEYEYDAYKLNVARTTNELGHIVETDYDLGTGVILERRGPNMKDLEWEKERWKVDGFGRMIEHLISIDNTSGGYDLVPIERTLYNDFSMPNRIKEWTLRDFGGTVWLTAESTLDGRGRLLETFLVISGVSKLMARHHYDAAGNVEKQEVVDPRYDMGEMITTRYTYDAIGRVRSVTRPDGTRLITVYEGLMQERTEVFGDGTGGIASYVFDVFGRLINVEETDPKTSITALTTYSYRPTGELDKISDADENVTEFDYDWLGRRTGVIRGSRIWLYTYDKNGNVKAVTSPLPSGANPEDFTTVMTYDPLNRVTHRIPASLGMSATHMADLGIGTITYTYDEGVNGIGRLSRVTLDPFGQVDYTYDARGLMIKEQRSIEISHPATIHIIQSVTRTYNALGQLALSEWDDGQKWQLIYDERGLVKTVEWYDPTKTAWEQVANYEYSLAGQIRKRKSSFGQIRDYTYDLLGRVEGDKIQKERGSNLEPVSTRTYKFFDSGDLRLVDGEIEGISVRASYTYDYQHRLHTASGPYGYLGTFTYSLTGNIDTANVTWNGSSYTRNVNYIYGKTDAQAVDQLITINNSKPYASFEYNISGDMTKRITSEGTEEFEWDDSNRIREAKGPSGTEIYYYDQTGNRIITVNEKGFIHFWFDENETIFGKASNSNIKYLHLSDGSSVLARVENQKILELQYSDALQNLMLSLDTDGNTAASFIYGPFGEVLHAIGDENHHRQFNGKENDSTTGLRYYGARFYDPLLLRWNSSDPIARFAPEIDISNPQAVNLYSFTINNPLRFLDLYGLSSASVDECNEICVHIANEMSQWFEDPHRCIGDPLGCMRPTEKEQDPCRDSRPGECGAPANKSSSTINIISYFLSFFADKSDDEKNDAGKKIRIMQYLKRERGHALDEYARLLEKKRNIPLLFEEYRKYNTRPSQFPSGKNESYLDRYWKARENLLRKYGFPIDIYLGTEDEELARVQAELDQFWSYYLSGGYSTWSRFVDLKWFTEP